MNEPLGNQIVRDAIRQFEIANSVPPKQARAYNKGDGTLSIKNDPTHKGYDWGKERGTFIVPNTNLEENDG